MEVQIRQPSILRLRGLNITDYISGVDEIFDKKIMENVESEKFSDEIIDGIPRTFTDLTSWPLKTNILCWQCGFEFDKRPKFIPTSIRETGGHIEIGVHGNMCSFGCVELWIEIHYRGDKLWRLQNNLRLLYFIFMGKQTHRIFPSPNKTELKIYGGNKSQSDFIKEINYLDDQVDDIILPESERINIVPEQDRIPQILSTLKIDTKIHKKKVEDNSIWQICIPSILEAAAVSSDAAVAAAGDAAAAVVSSDAAVVSSDAAAAAAAAGDAAAAAAAAGALNMFLSSLFNSNIS